ncbi:MAG: class I SAM-dependent methyltransferase [Phycicoccus sp.]
MPVDSDVYADLAEFHDLFMVEPWERLRPHVRSQLAGLPPAAVVADLGAGTGMGTRVLAEESAARVVALEPSPMMRSVLLARVADSPDLRERVTVHAGSVPADLGLLPDRVDAVLCTHVLGHLTPDERRMTFAWLGDHLASGGPVLVTTHVPRDDGQESEVMEQRRRIGELDYVVRYEEAPDAESFRSRYLVRSGPTVLRDVVVDGAWRPVGVDDLRAEIAGVGLAMEPVADGIAVLRRTPAHATR